MKTFHLGQFVPEDAHKVGGSFRIQMIGVGEILEIFPKPLVEGIVIVNDTCVRYNAGDGFPEFLQELLRHQIGVIFGEGSSDQHRCDLVLLTVGDDRAQLFDPFRHKIFFFLIEMSAVTFPGPAGKFLHVNAFVGGMGGQHGAEIWEQFQDIFPGGEDGQPVGDDVHIGIVIGNVFRREEMVVAHTHGLSLRPVHHFVVEGKVGDGDKEDAAVHHILSKLLQDRIIVIKALARVGKIKTDIAPGHNVVIDEVVGAVGTAQIADMDFPVIPPQHVKFEDILIFLLVDGFVGPVHQIDEEHGRCRDQDTFQCKADDIESFSHHDIPFRIIFFPFLFICFHFRNRSCSSVFILEILELEVNKLRRHSFWGKQCDHDKQQHIHRPADEKFLSGKCGDDVTFQGGQIVECKKQYRESHAHGGDRRDTEACDTGLQVVHGPFNIPEKPGDDPQGILNAVCPEEDPGEAQQDKGDGQLPPVPAPFDFQAFSFFWIKEGLQDLQQAMYAAPQNISQAAAVPETADEKSQEQIQAVPPSGSPAAAQRDVDIVPEPGRQRDMPAAPEFPDGKSKVRAFEIRHQFDAEQSGTADGDIRVAGKVAVYFNGKHGCSNKEGQSHIGLRVVVDAVDGDGQHIGDHQFLIISPCHQF